ncbi:hypothetical protein D9757_005976 [Collybiopsis confluens]|uniref:Uncharacterized protein n=1 Tax=Collybiopsis confluens TaxID=2823264 RepID=A0A8H5MDL0_9AGAR|nr:hypothetical protein D9757_005976 [Collybiopsis confluens]
MPFGYGGGAASTKTFPRCGMNRRLAIRIPQQLFEAVPAQDFSSLLESLNATKELELHYVPPTDPNHIYLTISKNPTSFAFPYQDETAESHG